MNVDNIINKLKTTRILAAVSISLSLLGLLLPYIKVTVSAFGYTDSKSASLIDYWEGYIMLVSIVAYAIFIFKDKIEAKVPRVFNNSFANKIKNANNKLSIIPSIVCIILMIIIQSNKSDASSLSYAKVTYGVGFYFILLGIIAAIVFAFLYKPGAGVSPAVQPATNDGGLNQFMGMNTPQPTQGLNQFMNQNVVSGEQNASNALNNPLAPNMSATPDSSASIEPQVQAQPSVKYCPNCGSQASSDAAFCVGCGNKL